MTTTTIRSSRHASRSALGAAGLLALAARACLPGDDLVATAVLCLIAALPLIAVLFLGNDRGAIAAAFAGVVAVVILPPGELVGLVVGTAALVAVALAVADEIRRNAPISVLGASLVALVLHVVTAPEGLLVVISAPNPSALLALVGPPLMVGVAAVVLARAEPALQVWWLVLLLFALGGGLDRAGYAVLPLLAAAAVALARDPGVRLPSPDSRLPPWQPALAWVVLAAGALLVPALTLLVIARAMAHRSRTLLVLLAGAAAVAAVERLGFEPSLLVVVGLLAVAALAGRPLRELPADLALLGAAAPLGPAGWVVGFARIAPRPEPWLASLAAIGLVGHSFPWLAQGWPMVPSRFTPAVAALVVGGLLLAVAARLRPRWTTAVAGMLLATPLVLVGSTIRSTPIWSEPRDLTSETPVLEVTLDPPRRISSLVIDSQLAFATGLPQGATVGSVELRGVGGETLGVVALRNGIDTAEWAAGAEGVEAPAGPRLISWIAPAGTHLGSRSRTELAGSWDEVAGVAVGRSPLLPAPILLTVHGMAAR